MAILKCANVGDELRLQVADVQKVQGQYNPQYAITDANNDVLYVSEGAFERFLDKMGCEMADVVNQWLHIWRDPNPKGKPFWGIAFAADSTQPARKIPIVTKTVTTVAGRPAISAANTTIDASSKPLGTRQLMLRAQAAALRDLVPVFLAAGASIEEAVRHAKDCGTSQFIECNKSNMKLGTAPTNDDIQKAQEYIAVAGVLPVKAKAPAPKPVAAPEPPPPMDDDFPGPLPVDFEEVPW